MNKTNIIIGSIITTSIMAIFFSCSDNYYDSPKQHLSDEPKEIILINWEKYFDLSVLKDFEKQTGIHVTLKEYGQVDELISRLQSDPTQYDIIITDWVAMSFLIKSKMLAKLELSRLPNFKHIDKHYKNLPFDADNTYSIPYLYGTTGLAVNTRFVKEPVTSWNVLYDPRYKSKIALMADPRETMTAILKSQGLSVNTKNRDQLKVAEGKALLLRENGVVFSNYYPLEKEIKKGNVWIAMAYSGDLLKATQKNPDIVYVLPVEGSNKFIDNYTISRYSKKTEEVYAFLNFILDPKIAARISNSQFYASPNRDAAPMIRKDIRSNPIIYPPKESLDRCEYLDDVGEMHNEYVRIYNLMQKKSLQ
ncbi:MAG: spermidine/putrescine ABC transporter substrate-binding protein [Deltaproteobacteria bacterium]|nr:spermidine/putrescine ABC transporter substrate-binding protein [Deltaproteobacteria bacterium]